MSERYVVADDVNQTTIIDDIFKLFKLIFIILKVLVQSVPIICHNLKHLIFPKPEKSIAGQLALVTGGGNGLGRSIALELAKHGCNIIVWDIDKEAAEQTASDARNFNIHSKGYQVDVSDFKSVKKGALVIYEEFGSVDILVNNAGLLPWVSLREGSPEDIEEIIRTNLTSHLWTIRVFIESMIRRRKGHIVAISSYAGLDSFGRAITYTATKHGIKGLMDALYEELKLEGREKEIILTTVFPTIINTRKKYIDDIKISTKSQKVDLLLTPAVVGAATVNGILNNKRYISVPKYIRFFTNYLALLPTDLIELIRDTTKPKILRPFQTKPVN